MGIVLQCKCVWYLKARWIMVLLLMLHTVRPHTAQSDSCNANLNIVAPNLKFNVSTLQCVNVWNNFILRHAQNDVNVLSILLSAPYANNGWVGMGFSKNGVMVGSSAMVGWINSDALGTIKQYYLGGKSQSEVKPDDTHLVVIENSTVAMAQGSTMYLAFQLQFNEPLKSRSILYAVGDSVTSDNKLSQHTDKFSTTFDFSTGASSTSSSTDTLKRNHGALNIFGWGVLLPIGSIIARYFRQWDPAWFYLHIGFQVSGFIFGVAGVAVGVALYNKLNADVEAHRGLGIFILVLGILQVLALLLRPQKEAKVRKYWNWYHHWFGRLALFLAAVNIVYGIHVADAGKSWKVGYGFVLALILIIVAVLESALWIKWSRRPPETPSFQMYNTRI